MPVKRFGKKHPTIGSISKSKGKAPASSSGKAPLKGSVDGLPSNTFPIKSRKESYMSSYRCRNLLLDRTIDLQSFSDSTIPLLFSKLKWNSLASFTGSANINLVKLFYANIIEHNLDLMMLKSIIFGKEFFVTPRLITEVLGIPMVDGPSANDFYHTPDLLERASMDLWGENQGPIGNVVHTSTLCRSTWVFASFILHSIFPSS